MLIIGFSILYFGGEIESYNFYFFTSIAWIVLSLNTKFYDVYRYTKNFRIAILILKQLILFTLIIFAFFGYKKQVSFSTSYVLSFISALFSAITLVKYSFFYFLQKYRSSFGGNFRRIIIIGNNKKTHDLENLFKTRPELGYKHCKTFDFKNEEILQLKDCFDYISNEDIDEIYCSVSELSNKKIAQLIDFVDNNLKVLKFIPDNRDIYTKRLKYEYYDYIPILWLRNIPLEDPINKFFKRTLDIVFSLFVIVGILSWLAPIMALLITIESRGPVFFRQQRNGFNNKKFYCYKFRSMAKNNEADKIQAQKNDARVTKVGGFIRKTSIDELPQFFNVLFGDMSVVGPRPHMLSHTTEYASKVDKFMVRLFVKPGITGLAQVRGFRGEIETDKDIIGRVKYDIFYIENWSLLLDIKIIIQTVINAVKGEEKAY
ncbi:undecaprenyl-phosphate glucose phosphotransferase [Winogradskyella sp. E313]|uniref:Undecaprenyl-phosphate glucose phosphotransferase n=2 Tax=Winogradskyella immobilis TaxID=2816852 RepID=A0ABS8EMG0_9FLAO|nr:undecaprenyl-phosphate glucose phosphotransferase [Winogradskyella immobilis]